MLWVDALKQVPVQVQPLLLWQLRGEASLEYLITVRYNWHHVQETDCFVETLSIG